MKTWQPRLPPPCLPGTSPSSSPVAVLGPTCLPCFPGRVIEADSEPPCAPSVLCPPIGRDPIRPSLPPIPLKQHPLSLIDTALVGRSRQRRCVPPRAFLLDAAGPLPFPFFSRHEDFSLFFAEVRSPGNRLLFSFFLVSLPRMGRCRPPLLPEKEMFFFMLFSRVAAALSAPPLFFLSLPFLKGETPADFFSFFFFPIGHQGSKTERQRFSRPFL